MIPNISPVELEDDHTIAFSVRSYALCWVRFGGKCCKGRRMVQEEVVVPDTVVLPQCRVGFNSAEGLRFWGEVNVMPIS